MRRNGFAVVGDFEDAIMKISGDRNQCQGCKEFFNSSAAFDKHRTGAFGSPMGDGTYMMHSRRCRTVAEMEAAGMAKNSSGFWVTALNPMGYPLKNSQERPFGWELIG
jgi:hypothetical protein